MKAKGIIGIDLAGLAENPTGWALLENRTVRTSLIYSDKEILEGIAKSEAVLVGIDAPFNFPKNGPLRKADREMIRRGCRVFPPNLPGMKKLTERTIRLNKLITEKGYKTLEVHPTSTRKALNMPLKEWNEIQRVLANLGLKGELETRPLATHEIDAVAAALTVLLYLRSQTVSIGDEEECYVILPKKIDWRTLTL